MEKIRPIFFYPHKQKHRRDTHHVQAHIQARHSPCERHAGTERSQPAGQHCCPSVRRKFQGRPFGCHEFVRRCVLPVQHKRKQQNSKGPASPDRTVRAGQKRRREGGIAWAGAKTGLLEGRGRRQCPPSPPRLYCPDRNLWMLNFLPKNQKDVEPAQRSAKPTQRPVPNYAVQGILRAFPTKPDTVPFRHDVKTSYTPTAQRSATLKDAEATLVRRTSSPFARHF